MQVPAAVDAEVPGSEKPAKNALGVKFVRQESGHAVFLVGSGVYKFTVHAGESR